MYLADNNDRLWPEDHDAGALDYFNTYPGGGSGSGDCPMVTAANPYLRPPVVLHEYVKNRDVWRCPSARVETGANFICPSGPYGYWVNAYSYSDGSTWGRTIGGPCDETYPPGWGGIITDSFVQGLAMGIAGTDTPHKAFVKSLGFVQDIRSMFAGAVRDPVNFILIGESGCNPEFWVANTAAFPDICWMTACGWDLCDSSGAVVATCGSDGTAVCHANYDREDMANIAATEDDQNNFWSDSTIRKRYTRHLGGNNFGFLDGHARWMLADEFLTKVAERELDGFCGACIPGVVLDDGTAASGHFPGS
jgi:prepilin-type processing-associated H-X9-DG protein